MLKTLSSFERQLCDIQGRLFERSLMYDLDSCDFVGKFMNSEICMFFDMPYDRMQWAGEELLLESLLDEIEVNVDGETFNKEELYWIGYIFRYWHLLTGENSREIYAQADARKMKDCYLGFHTLDAALAIEHLIEINRQEQLFFS